ncbi:EF-hand calcium-binding domain-containing protein 14 isoform X1 [Aplysia californica]|uniref:EF-hand calcium-binding domain-containing protein 14 isoform X1 n=2 Tax=Aplysia californica TaxID=6500 RepID=A0ABM0JND8_APLCA|nr:EF-hand calcium-binding domain-containing protein 14 isoform X1 [Aplysia californica]
MMKADVDYKLPKRMKKRRQLDALVDTVKLPRNRINSTSAQELLDYHSDSSDLEEYSASSIGHSRKKCCLCHTVVARIGLFMVTMACLTTCVGLVWVQWHIRHELDILRREVNSVQNADKTSPELMKFQSQLTTINGTVNSLKAENIQSMTKDIKGLKDQMDKLAADTERLSKSVTSASEILDIPNKLKSLQETVATATNELVDLKQKVEKLMEPKPSPASPSAASTPASELSAAGVDAQYATMLSEEFLNLNRSTVSQLSEVRKALDQQSSRISVLETSLAEAHPAGLGIEAIEDIVQGTVREMLANTTSRAVNDGQNTDQVSAEQLDIVKEQVESIMGDVKKMESASDRVSFGDYSAFKEDTIANFEEVNSTLLSLNRELDAVSMRISSMGQNLIKMTTALGQGGLLMPGPVMPEASAAFPSNGADAPSEGTAAGESTANAAAGENTDGAAAEDSTDGAAAWDSTANAAARDGNIPSNDSTSGKPSSENGIPSEGESSGPPQDDLPTVSTAAHETPAPTESQNSGLSLSNVNTIEDLKKFMSTLPLKEGQIELSVLTPYLDNADLDQGKMETFDLDRNGLLSAEELAAALGLQDSPRR